MFCLHFVICGQLVPEPPLADFVLANAWLLATHVACGL